MLIVTEYSKVWCGKLALNLCRLTRRLYTISEARSEVDRPLVATVWDDGNKVDVQSHDGSLDRLHILIGFFCRISTEMEASSMQDVKNSSSVLVLFE